MLEFHRIPPYSTIFHWNGTGIGLDFSGIQAFLQEWHWNSDFFSLYKVIF